MSRKPKKARRKFDTRLSFNELSRRLGLTPRQRIQMRRYLLEFNKKALKGGENYE